MKELEQIGEFRVHPVASIFPMMGEMEAMELGMSISDLGLQEPVVVHEGLLVDGRNRVKACIASGNPIKTIEWSKIVAHNKFHTGKGGMDDLPATTVDQWIMAKNVARRNLTPDQIAAVWSQHGLWEEAEDAKARQVRKPQDSVDLKSGPQNPERDIAQKNANSTVGRIAKKSGVSRHKAGQAVKLVKAVEAGTAPKEDLELVKAGLKKLNDAVRPLKPSKPEPAPQTLEERVKADLERMISRYEPGQQDEVKRFILETLSKGLL